MRVAVFFALFFICSVLGLVIGQRPERQAAATLLLGGIASIAVQPLSVTPWGQFEPLLALIDLAMLSAFLVTALRSDRIWLLFATGFQGMIVVGHILRLAYPGLARWEYWFSQAIWSWPVVLLVGAGAILHRRQLKRHRAHF